MAPDRQRRSLDDAISWIDGAIARSGAESVPVASAAGRVLAEKIRAVEPMPLADRAAVDGFAVAADGTVGASAYNPLLLPLRAIAAGNAMPPGTDAVIPLDLGEPLSPGGVECVEAVAPGDNVEAQGCVAAPGALLAAAGAPLSPALIGLLIAAGRAKVAVVRRPRLRIVTAPGDAPADSNGPMCRALAERDGALVGDIETAERTRPAIRQAIEIPGADLVLVIGGTGRGAGDHAAAALAEAGDLAIHGVALRPGETAGFGHTSSGTSVILLPGAPAACFVAYEMLAGRAVRRLGGRHPALPYRTRPMRTARKIVSVIGMTELCPVRRTTPDLADPLPSFAEIGLMAAVAADGFVIVPEGSEGFPQGAPVTVCLYEGSGTRG